MQLDRVTPPPHFVRPRPTFSLSLSLLDEHPKQENTHTIFFHSS